MEKLTQEELTAVRSFIYAFRAAEKMDKALTAMLTLDEQATGAETRHTAAMKRLGEINQAIAAKEKELKDAESMVENGLADLRKRDKETVEMFKKDLEAAKKAKDDEFAVYLDELKARKGIADRLHASAMSDMEKSKKRLSDEIKEMELNRANLARDIKTLESAKADLQEQFKALLK